MPTAGVILSGGKSTRMGLDKSQLLINNTTLLERTKNLLSASGINSIHVSGQGYIEDGYENKGPLAGILASLKVLENKKNILFIPIDMPLLNKEILIRLIKEKPIRVKIYENHNLPIFIRNSQETRAIIESQIINNKLSINQLLKVFNAQKIKHVFSEDCFINTNTPEQWQKAKLLLQEVSP